MSMETFSLMLAIIGSSAGATWVLRTKLGDIESTLRVHVTELKSLKGRVISLEQKRARR